MRASRQNPTGDAARRVILDVRDFGRLVEGSTTYDNGPVFAAAGAAAAALAVANGAGTMVTVTAPAGRYRIRTSITHAQAVRWELPGVILIGPIDGYPAITTATTPADPLDLQAQAGGGCFSDIVAQIGVAYGQWVGVQFNDFRYGITNVGALAYALTDRVQFNNCNIGVFGYGPFQEPRFRDTASIGARAGTTIVGAATCFPAGHPKAGLDNYFADGVWYHNGGRYRNGSVVNAQTEAFADWFEASILRPDTDSVVLNYTGKFDFPVGSTARRVNGRSIYIPSRNGRAIYSPNIKGGVFQGSPRGAVLIGNMFGGVIEDVGGEGMFIDMPPLSESMVVLLNNSNASMYGTLSRIAAPDPDAGNTNRGNAIAIIERSSSVGASGSLNALSIRGDIVGARHFRSLEQFGRPNVQRGLEIAASPSSNAATNNGADTLLQDIGGLADALVDDTGGTMLSRRIWAITLPNVAGGTRVKGRMRTSGLAADVTKVVSGPLELHLRRMDTGELDFGRYLVNISTGYAAATTLASNATSGDTQVTLTSTTGYTAGVRVLIGGDAYVLESPVGAGTWNLGAPLRTSYAAGASVAPGNQLTVITAQTNGWITPTVDSAGLLLTNTIVGAPRVKVFATLGSLGPLDT